MWDSRSKPAWFKWGTLLLDGLIAAASQNAPDPGPGLLSAGSWLWVALPSPGLMDFFEVFFGSWPETSFL